MKSPLTGLRPRRAAHAGNMLADLYAVAIAEAAATAGVPVADIVAAGVHGQTVRHRPDQGWTLQLNNAARVAERAGVTVVNIDNGFGAAVAASLINRTNR